MKLVVAVKLLPTPEQAAALAGTLRTTNTAATWLAEQAQTAARRGRTELQCEHYPRVKAVCLSAQPALHVIRKVADAYTTRAANLIAGNYGPKGSRRRERVESSPIRFRPDAAQPFDDRCLSWQYDTRTVSIWTTAGRMKNLCYTGSADQLKALQLRATEINHQISKRIVVEAQRTAHGIGLEVLTGIRERVRLRKPQRPALHSWGFHQLGSFIEYKAHRAGVVVVFVDAAYTSQTCRKCGHTGRANRPNQARFCCRACGFVEHADRNASHNIAARAAKQWGSGAQSAAPAPVQVLDVTRLRAASPELELRAWPFRTRQLTRRTTHV
ncbi:RNA-guided endonuclease InsQ/TnpB family protein [Nocardia rhizosphaerihabitans]|uniref:RNA-guided endonuclease InsQ/TnpB family protein n=1 Tax=Nocardia rhizosphaerihabitans TaxID=1691570 RepID=UPI00366EF7BA